MVLVIKHLHLSLLNLILGDLKNSIRNKQIGHTKSTTSNTRSLSLPPLPSKTNTKKNPEYNPDTYL